MVLKVETILVELGDKRGLQVGTSDPDTIEYFNDRGLDGNGYTWSGVVDSIARLEMPSEYGKLDWSPEADDLLVISSDLDLLKRLETLVQRFAGDEAKMQSAMENADPEMMD